MLRISFLCVCENFLYWGVEPITTARDRTSGTRSRGRLGLFSKRLACICWTSVICLRIVPWDSSPSLTRLFAFRLALFLCLLGVAARRWFCCIFLVPWPHDMISKKEQEFNNLDYIMVVLGQLPSTNLHKASIMTLKYIYIYITLHVTVFNPMLSVCIQGWLEKSARRIRWSSVWVPQVLCLVPRRVLRERFELKVLKVRETWAMNPIVGEVLVILDLFF